MREGRAKINIFTTTKKQKKKLMRNTNHMYSQDMEGTTK
jgi:hypothetical protein